MEQGGLFAPEPASGPTAEDMQRKIRETVARVEKYLEKSWRTAEKLLSGDDPEALFALGRAYYGVYNGLIFSAILLGIDRSRYRSGSLHHEEQDAIFHSHLPVLGSDLVKALDPPRKPGDRHERAEKTFRVCRELQKYRKRADYMGLETVSAATARERIAEGREVVSWVWEHVREQLGIKPGDE